MWASPGRVMPATEVRRELHGRSRTPAARFVLERRRRIAENPLHNCPRRLYAVLAGKEHRISAHRVAEQALVWCHLVAGCRIRELKFDRLGREVLPRPL